MSWPSANRHLFVFPLLRGDCRAALIWWLWATWVSSWASNWFLDQSWFVLPSAVNVNNTIMVPSECSSVSHFSFTNTAVEQPQCTAFWTLVIKYSVIWSYFFLVFWLSSSLPEKKKNQQLPAFLPLRLECYSKETSPKHSSMPRLGPRTAWFQRLIVFVKLLHRRKIYYTIYQKIKRYFPKLNYVNWGLYKLKTQMILWGAAEQRTLTIFINASI